MRVLDWTSFIGTESIIIPPGREVPLLSAPSHHLVFAICLLPVIIRNIALPCPGWFGSILPQTIGSQIPNDVSRLVSASVACLSRTRVCLQLRDFLVPIGILHVCLSLCLISWPPFLAWKPVCFIGGSLNDLSPVMIDLTHVRGTCELCMEERCE